MFKDKKLIIFDMDGTLIDSAPSLTYAVNHTLQALGKEPITINEAKSYIGNGATILMHRALVRDRDYQKYNLDPKYLQDALNSFLEFYGKNLNEKTTLYPNVIKTLRALKSKNIKLALATNKPHQFVQQMLEHFKIYEFFDTFIGSSDSIKRKPNPDILFECCKQTNINPKDSLMVGDSANDINAAKNANIDSIFVTYGYCNKPDSIAPTIKIDNIEDILNYL